MINAQQFKDNLDEMRFNRSLLWDKTCKLLLIVAMLTPFLIFEYLDYITNYYVGDIIKDTNIYGSISVSSILFSLVVFGISLYIFVQTITESKFNTLKVENALSSFFNNKFRIKLGNWAFYLVLIIFSGIAHSAIIEYIILTVNDVKLYSEFNAVTLEKSSYYGHAFSMIYFFGALIISLTLLAISLRPNNLNNKILFGSFVIPLVINFLFNYPLLEFSIELPSVLVNQFPNLLVISITLKLFFVIFLVMTMFFYFRKEVKKHEKSFIEIIKDLKFVAIGYLMTSISAIIVGSYLCFSPTVEHFKNDPNEMTVRVYDNEYVINQTLLTAQDNRETEYLIETFVGLSMHNAMSSLELLLSDAYVGNKEKSIKFVADLLLINLRHQEEKYKRTLDILKNEKISLSTSMNFLIPVVIYEASPLHHQERSLTAIINGEYQNGVKYYLEDAVNRKEVEKTSLKSGKNNERIGSLGHPILQRIISALISNNMAKLNYTDVNEEQRDTLRESIEEFSPSIFFEPPNDKLIEKWFDIFKADRLVNHPL